MIFDAVVLAAILISAVIAFLRGFIREFLTIAGVIGGLAAAYAMGPALQPVMRDWLGVKDAAEGEPQKQLFDIIPMSIVADVLAYGSVFLFVVIVLSVLSHFIAAGVKAIGLGPVDRILGVIFGIARAILLLALIYLPFLLLVPDAERDEWFAGSLTRTYIEKTSQWIADYLPENTDEKLDDAGRRMDEMGERLEDMDVLKNAADKAALTIETLEEKNEADPSVPQPDPVDNRNNDGYQPEQRETMDQLIENNQGQTGAAP